MDATFMTELNISSVRHLKNIYIPLSETEPKTLILTGKNGSGKTSVLEALEKFLEYVVSDSYQTKEYLQSMAQTFLSRLIPKPRTEDEKARNEEAKKNASVWVEQLQQWESVVPKYTSYVDLKKKYQDGTYILAYYNDNREIQVNISKNIEKVDLKTTYSMKEHPSRELVKYMVNLKTTEAFAKLHGNSKRAEDIGAWFERFTQVLRRIYEDENLKMKFDDDTFEFSILQTGREPFDFNSMSMGYAAVFDIISDLMMRMESQHRYDLEGLILIDEVETHLHVELQKKIMPILTELFPKLQFVITTHSPFVLNSTRNAVVYDLETGTLVENGLTDLPYGGIIEGYFKVDTLSQELKEKFEEYKHLMQKEVLTDADFARASELETYLDEVPDYLALDFATEYGRLKLELSKRG